MSQPNVDHKRAAALIRQHEEADAILGDDTYSHDEQQNAAAMLLHTSIELGRMGYTLDASERWMYPVSSASVDNVDNG